MSAALSLPPPQKKESHKILCKLLSSICAHWTDSVTLLMMFYQGIALTSHHKNGHMTQSGQSELPIIEHNNSTQGSDRN